MNSYLAFQLKPRDANTDEMRAAMLEVLGQEKYDHFFDKFLEYFFTEADAKAFADLGLNAIRLPVSTLFLIHWSSFFLGLRDSRGRKADHDRLVHYASLRLARHTCCRSITVTSKMT